MSARKLLLWVLGLSLFILFSILVFQAGPARADEGAPTVLENGCKSCHENLYYQYDYGKHYCLNDANATCVDCHDGNAESLEKEAAHEGMVRYPIHGDDISRCQSCHPQDAQLHVRKFADVAGYHAQVKVVDQVQPNNANQDTAGTSSSEQIAMDSRNMIGLSVIIAIIAALFVFCFFLNRSCRVG